MEGGDGVLPKRGGLLFTKLHAVVCQHMEITHSKSSHLVTPPVQNLTCYVFNMKYVNITIFTVHPPRHASPAYKILLCLALHCT